MQGNPGLQGNDPLAQLRGLHLPQETGLWPPAPIWWLIAAVVIGLIVWAWWRYRQYKQARAYREQAIAATKTIVLDDNDCLHQLQRILRRAALTADPAARAEIAPLSGETWFEYLNSCCDKPVFDETLIADAANAHYSNAANDSKLNAAVQQAALRWLKEHR